VAKQRRDPEQRPSPEALPEAARRRAVASARARDFPRLGQGVRGTISAANRTDRNGAVLTIRLPIPAAVDAQGTTA
jgi:hypothetical protein